MTHIKKYFLQCCWQVPKGSSSSHYSCCTGRSALRKPESWLHTDTTDPTALPMQAELTLLQWPKPARPEELLSLQEPKLFEMSMLFLIIIIYFFLSTYHLLYMRPERWGCTWLREVKQKKFLNPITAVTHILRAKGFQISRVRNDKGSLTGIFPAQTCGMIQHFWDRRNIQIVSELQNGPTLPKLLMLKERAAVPEQQMFPM